ncbi:MAG: right-handed parallel beta-helix repeat-containing protein [Actinobacteria bacterium]|nr:right-handed parallel beta-helix repeat-containing protein [Actinomycetota bacterium]
MKIFSLGTKIQVIGTCLLLVALTLTSVFAVTQTISDTGDTVDTYIRNSKGNYWAATGANIQTAIWDLNSTSGGTVWLPVGTINHTSSISMENNVHLMGAGMYKTILRFTDGASTSLALIRAKIKNNFSISDLTIDGNDDGATCSNGVQLDGVKYFTVQNVYIHDTDGNGLWIGGEAPTYTQCKNGLVDNVHATNVDAIALECFAFNNISDTIFSNLHSSGGTAAYQIDFHAIRNSTINNIYCSDGGGMKIYGLGAYWCEDSVYNNIVISNLVQPTDAALWVYQTRRTSISNVQVIADYAGITIDTSNNINLNNVGSLSGTSSGLHLHDSNYINVDNAIVRSAVQGFRVDTCNNVTVSNMQISLSTLYNYLYNSKDVVISNSFFNKGASYGLDIDACARFRIIGCSFWSNTEDGITTELGTCNNYTISNCYFKGNDKALDLHASDNWFIVSGCIAPSGDNIDVNAALTYYRKVNDTICTLVTS